MLTSLLLQPKVVTLLSKLFSRATAAGQAKEALYSQWVSFASEHVSLSEALEVAKRATEAFPKSGNLWTLLISTMDAKLDSPSLTLQKSKKRKQSSMEMTPSDVMSTLQQALASVPQSDSLPLYRCQVQLLVKYKYTGARKESESDDDDEEAEPSWFRYFLDQFRVLCKLLHCRF